MVCGVLIQHMSRKNTLMYTTVKNFDSKYSVSVIVNIMAYNDSRRHSIDWLNQIELTGYRIKCPKRFQPYTVQPYIFYHSSWNNFKIDIRIKDVFYSTHESVTLLIKDGKFRPNRRYGISFTNLDILPFASHSFYLNFKDTTITHYNFFMLFPMSLRIYECKILGKITY
ncbi:hypothetical protein RF11_06213 [Thelohanellus kitauei]|uniref:Uncharacterized protein n=1 Tax=Thelohanellus kitauei TaxID=669202 RepID=A0A0C2J3N9_THEKT|nr:hypothetical protein RF11_06213 [Thelohanellus kitauei]